MKFFSFGSKSKDNAVPRKHDDETSTGASVSSRTSDNAKKRKNKSKSKKTSKGTEAKTLNTTGTRSNADIATEWMAAMTSFEGHDAQSFADMWISYFESAEDSKIILEDGEAYSPAACAPLLYATYLSFPDLAFPHAPIKDNPKDPNSVDIEEIYVSGTHKGAPYTLMPGALPEVPPSGKFISNDEQRFLLKMKNGKIQKCEVVALGSFTGFAGLYTQAGGSLEAPVDNDGSKE
ncbi:hypothetical protein SEMRO_2722_G335590.1 [Seminavis robusta]|uniref:Uncharacterized protein n=1 Tax=Seminavis robusta TaxID=568900 RepID=A0A9N8HY37_9STRA|nr:hypothetical protein SEMRO_2722_G335590.1 [Seminavis robusta]|eukprot:Sro2722_g335590.1 n/a (234) ;mRNA; r:10274-10975